MSIIRSLERQIKELSYNNRTAVVNAVMKRLKVIKVDMAGGACLSSLLNMIMDGMCPIVVPET